MNNSEKLIYVNNEGAKCEVRGCNLVVDNLGRHYIWSEQLQYNLVYKTKGRENALLSAIDSLLFYVQLQGEKINSLQRIADLAEGFAEKITQAEGKED